jgi:hypothetical protein
MADPILGEGERKPLTAQIRLCDDGDAGHLSTSPLVKTVKERTDQPGDFGTGLNLPLYSASVQHLIGLDPSPRLLEMGQAK